MKRPFRLERDPITGLTRAVDFEIDYNNKGVEMLDYFHLRNEDGPKFHYGRHTPYIQEPKTFKIKTKKKKKSEPCGTGYMITEEEFKGTFKDKDIYSNI